MQRAVAVLVAAAALACTASAAFTLKSTYVIQGEDDEGLNSFVRKFGPLADYLTATVGSQYNPPINFVAKSIPSINKFDFTADGNDFAITNAGVAACEMRAGVGQISVLAAYYEYVDGVFIQNSGGTIFTRADSNIFTVEDMRGKIIESRTPSSLRNFQSQACVLQDEDFYIYSDPSQLIMTNSQDAIAIDVLKNRYADVGMIASGALEKLVKAGVIEADSYRIINPQTQFAEDGSLYPYQISTQLYPEWPFLSHGSVPITLRIKVAEALLGINRTHPTAQAAHIAGWVAPLPYLSVIDAQVSAGLLPPDSNICLDASKIEGLVVCRPDEVRKSPEEILGGCAGHDVFCPKDTNGTDYTCICNPCKPACENGKVLTSGTCSCPTSTVEMGGSCVPTAVLALVIAFPTLMLLFACFYVYMKIMLRRADNMWRIKPSELKFKNPVTVLGAGSFGVVLHAELRGSAVALKSIRTSRSNHAAVEGGASTAGITSTAGTSTAGTITRAMRTTGGAIVKFIEGNYANVQDEHRRGVLRLKRAFSQAEKQIQEKEAEERKAKGQDKTKTHGTMSLCGVGSLRGRNGTRSRHRGTYFSLKTKNQQARDDLILEMRVLSKLRSPWTVNMIGAVLDSNCDPVLVMEYMDLGSLHSILHNSTVDVDPESMRMMILDIVQGCRFLHANEPPVVHGDLKTMNVLVDSRFRAKVADFGLSIKYKAFAGTPYWMAPEMIQGEPASKASDVYAFGVVLYEIVTRRDPYEGEDFETVLKDVVTKQRRPTVPADAPSDLATIMHECWHWDAARRPSFLELERRLCHFDSLHTAQRNLKRNKGNNVVLNQVFPPHVAKALADGQKLEPEHFDSVTIFFSDIQGFTDISRTLAPEKVCDMLDRLYTRFDILSDKHDVFKVETIGDAYMAVTNLHAKQDNHAERVALFALDAIKAAQATLIDETEPARGSVNIRVGFHTGPVVANVVGTKNPRYCLFGDTVNTASRMESSSQANRVHISGAARDELVREGTKLTMQSRGMVEIKGKGMMETYWVGEHHDIASTGTGSGMTEEEMAEEVARRRSGRLSTASPRPASLSWTGHILPSAITTAHSARQSLHADLSVAAATASPYNAKKADKLTAEPYTSAFSGLVLTEDVDALGEETVIDIERESAVV